jgi:hypothetical protein
MTAPPLQTLCYIEPVFVSFLSAENKKTDVAERPEAFGHVGLLSNEPPGTAGLPFI